jgi:hypothetical protein
MSCEGILHMYPNIKVSERSRADVCIILQWITILNHLKNFHWKDLTRKSLLKYLYLHIRGKTWCKSENICDTIFPEWNDAMFYAYLELIKNIFIGNTSFEIDIFVIFVLQGHTPYEC